MREKIKILTILAFLSVLFFFPFVSLADGGIVYWPPDIHLSETGQKAICAFNGEKEVLIISNDLESDKETKALRIIPLPNKPEVKEGSFETFEKLVGLLDKKFEKMREGKWGETTLDQGQAPQKGVEILFEKKIGSHNLTVVKVNDIEEFLKWIKSFEEENNLSAKTISSEFREGVNNYLLRGINYFVFDVIEIDGKRSTEPLIYEFKTNYLFYPLLITGVSEVGEGSGRIQIFLITNEKNKNFNGFSGYPPVDLTLEELSSLGSSEILNLFNSSVKVRFDEGYAHWRFKDIKRDIVIPSYVWKRNLKMGDKGEDVSLLQLVLFSQDFYPSEPKGKVSGVFDLSTKLALMKFQEENRWGILEPLGLKKATGYFGPMTRNFLKGISLEFQKQEVFPRNLYLGMIGDDVMILQYLLRETGYWSRNDVKPTGYFGPITRQAVEKLQETYKDEILVPLGLKKATGFVGPATRKVLEKVYSKNIIF